MYFVHRTSDFLSFFTKLKLPLPSPSLHAYLCGNQFSKMSTYSHSYQNPLVHRLQAQNRPSFDAKPDCSSDEAIAEELSHDVPDHIAPSEPTAADAAAINQLLASPPTPSVSARSSAHNAPLSSFARSAFEHQASQAPFFFATGVEDHCT